MGPYEELLRVFSKRRKPEHFTNYGHCSDCKEFDDLLRSFTRDNISFSELGNIAWNPISSANVEGFLYYMPALARLALGKGDKYFLDQFMIHVNKKERLRCMTEEEKDALRNFLVYLRHEIQLEIEENLDGNELEGFIDKLRQ